MSTVFDINSHEVSLACSTGFVFEDEPVFTPLDVCNLQHVTFSEAQCAVSGSQTGSLTQLWLI